MAREHGIVLREILNKWDGIPEPTFARQNPTKIMVMSNDKFKINDRVFIRAEWGTSKQSYGIITKFENRGREIFAVIRWVGWKAGELEKDLGIKFPLHELTKKC